MPSRPADRVCDFAGRKNAVRCRILLVLPYRRTLYVTAGAGLMLVSYMRLSWLMTSGAVKPYRRCGGRFIQRLFFHHHILRVAGSSLWVETVIYQLRPTVLAVATWRRMYLYAERPAPRTTSGACSVRIYELCLHLARRTTTAATASTFATCILHLFGVLLAAMARWCVKTWVSCFDRTIRRLNSDWALRTGEHRMVNNKRPSGLCRLMCYYSGL